MFGIIATIGDKLSAGFHTLWATIIVLGIIIFVHEFGHFLSAKFFGMRVWIFSFGFGKRLWGFKRGDTDYRISLIPLGGYVKLEGEPEDFLSENTTKQGDTQDFLTRPRWQRFIMYFAGPLMNAVLTVGILTVAYMIGFPESSEKHSRPILGAVDPGLPAAQAGLRAGDEILTIDGQKISRWEELLYRVMISPEHALHLTIRRAGAEQTIDVRPIADGPERLGRIGVYPMVHVLELINDAPAMKAGVQLDDGLLFVDETPIRAPEDLSKAIIVRGEKTLQLTLYRQGQILTLGLTPRDSGDGPKIGVKPGAEHVLRRFGPIAALGAGIRYTAEMTGQVLGVLKGLVTRRVSPKAMGGLVGIAKGAAASANLGPLDFFVFIAFLSINVGILNLVPIVPLDGGHMFILLIEGAIRRNLNEKVKEWVMYAGTAAILLLFVFVLYSDFSKTELLRKYLP